MIIQEHRIKMEAISSYNAQAIYERKEEFGRPREFIVVHLNININGHVSTFKEYSSEKHMWMIESQVGDLLKKLDAIIIENNCYSENEEIIVI